jgi:pyruvate dehydrogenase (quinone)
VFGLPGDGINGIMEGLRRHQDRVRFVLVHHEEAAAFMAAGYAKATGRLGVCLATSGPGGIHLLNGLYDAKLDHAPVLAITGMQETQLLGTGYQQEVHLDRLFADVAGYNAMVHVPTSIPALVDLAVRHALANRTVSHLTIPNDVQEAPADAYPWTSVAPGRQPATAPVFLPAPGLPRPADLAAAAEALNRGARVAMLVGAGALGATAEVLEAADLLASPIVKTLPGKAAVVPLLERKADRDFLEQAQEAMGRWRADMAALEDGGRDPVQPQYLARVLDRLADDDAVLTADSGTVATWAARHYDIRGDRQCIAFVGDGGLAMLMAELDTAVRYELPVKVVVCNNASLGQILWEQMVLGFPEHGVRFSQPTRFAAFASARGALGLEVEKAAEVEPAVRQALAHPGPAPVDVMVNPDEPPLPGKVRYEQAKGFAQAWLRGQPRKATIASTLFRDKLQQLKG